MATGAQHEVEVILMKQVASYLATPVLVVDPTGDLVYFNEPAEKLLGRRYEETGAMPASEWSTLFTPVDEHGDPIPTSGLATIHALEERQPAHREMWITGYDGVTHHISVTAFPLVGQNDRHLGAVAIFWEHS